MSLIKSNTNLSSSLDNAQNCKLNEAQALNFLVQLESILCCLQTELLYSALCLSLQQSCCCQMHSSFSNKHKDFLNVEEKQEKMHQQSWGMSITLISLGMASSVLFHLISCVAVSVKATQFLTE